MHSSMAGPHVPFFNFFLSLLCRGEHSVATSLSIFSRSEHDEWMARHGTVVMSLEWHLEQWEAWDSQRTHHSMDSERRDGVNESIWLSLGCGLKISCLRQECELQRTCVFFLLLHKNICKRFTISLQSQFKLSWFESEELRHLVADINKMKTSVITWSSLSTMSFFTYYLTHTE